jgi:hypothetical protein
MPNPALVILNTVKDLEPSIALTINLPDLSHDVDYKVVTVALLVSADLGTYYSPSAVCHNVLISWFTFTFSRKI